MPPKVRITFTRYRASRLTRNTQRKRTEDSAAEAAPRATRTSSRNKSSATGTSGTTLAHDEKAKKSAKAKTEGGAEVCGSSVMVVRGGRRVAQAQPAAKKTKRATAAAKKGKGAAQDESSYVHILLCI